MLRINVNESCQLNFEIQIGGVQSDQLDSYFKIVYEGVEYGFPAKVGRESITVDLPPLNTVIGKRIKEGDEGEVKLEVIADGNYLTPWKDYAKFSNPLVIEAKIKDGGWIPKPTLKTKLVSSTEDGQKQGVIVKEEEEKAKKEDKKITEEEELTNKIVEKLSKKFATMFNEQETVNEPPVKPEDEEEVEESCGKDHSPKKKKTSENAKVEEQGESIVDKESMEKLLTQTLRKVGIFEDRGSKPKKKQITLQEFKRRLTKEDIFKYIEKAGTKNPKIQEIIYEQAAMSAKNDTPVEVLKQVINLMKKKKA
jgi:hypothetical protein